MPGMSWANADVLMFRLNKLLGHVIISQGGVVPHIAPVSVVLIHVEAELTMDAGTATG